MTYYELLGVSPTASPQDVKEAYRKAALLHHPDRGGTHEQMKAINEAYELLSDPEARSKYDAWLTEPPSDDAVAQPAQTPRAENQSPPTPEHVFGPAWGGRRRPPGPESPPFDWGAVGFWVLAVPIYFGLMWLLQTLQRLLSFRTPGWILLVLIPVAAALAFAIMAFIVIRFDKGPSAQKRR